MGHIRYIIERASRIFMTTAGGKYDEIKIQVPTKEKPQLFLAGIISP